ncbi:hypothetical protein SEVIR_7G103250v4 [Setaria viridis]
MLQVQKDSGDTDHIPLRRGQHPEHYKIPNPVLAEQASTTDQQIERTLTTSIAQALSPLMRRASWMSLGMIVTRLAWMAHRLVSSNRPTRYASAASCSAATAEDWNRRSVLKSCAISRTSRWNGSFRIRSSVLFWYLRISRSATVPGRNLWGFFTPPVAGADLRAALVASCLRGALPPVDLRAVCLVRAIGAGRGGWDYTAARGDWRIWGTGNRSANRRCVDLGLEVRYL